MNTPKDASDSQIETLYESAQRILWDHTVKLLSDPKLAAELDAQNAKLLGNPETVFRPRPEDRKVINLTRAYDLHFDLQTAAPLAQRWSCIDLNTYDGGSEGGVSAIIGRGPDRKAAMLDCLEQFGEFDEPDSWNHAQ